MKHRKVAVATIRGRPYYNIINALKMMNLQFDSISPHEADLSNAKVIITTLDEAGILKNKEAIMLDTELDKYPAIAKAKILKSMANLYTDDQLTIGIDPGSRVGISVNYLQQEISSTVESSLQRTVDHVSAILGGISSRKKIVKIGDGDIDMAQLIAKELKTKFRDGVHIEIVDEHGTSRNVDANRRGARDKSSARTIAFRTGKIYSLK